MSALLLLLAIASFAGLRLSGAGFSASTANPDNSFQAAASFSDMRFLSGTYTGNGVDNRAITNLGFQPDAVIVKGNTNQGGVMRTATMSGDTTKPLGGGATPGTDRIQSINPDGFTLGTNAQVNANGVSYYWMAFKAAPGEMKVGSYTGNGTGQAITGLGFSPEYVATLSGGNDPAVQRFAGMTSTFRFEADTGAADRITSFDADGFTVGSANTVNRSGTAINYVAFNAVAGSTDVGSYSGDGADNRSIAGVGFQPDYVMVRADDTSTLRQGIHRSASNSGDSSMSFNAAANAANRLQALSANGFELGTDGNANASGVAYRYIAFKGGAPPTGCTSPGNQTIQAARDAYVDQASPAQNFGSSSDLFVQSKSGNANRRTLVGFSLPTPPTGCSLTDATLRLFAASSASGRTIDVYRAGGTWTESGVTWNNAPSPAGGAISAASGNGWREWSVFSEVQAQYAGANDGFVVRDQTEGSAASPEQKYDSRENTNDPQLVLTFG